MEAEIGMMQPQAKECRGPPGALRAKHSSLLEPTEGGQPCCRLDFSPVTLIWGFWAPEQSETKFLLLKATQFVVSCYSSRRN